MSIILLTGPTASGKNTVAKILAVKRPKCSLIDVDDIRWMYLHPHEAPWEGEEGKQQQELGVENACLLAQNFEKKGVDVVLLDVVTNETAILYRERLPSLKIIQLMPTFDEAHKRFIERPHTISEDEFKLVYEWQQKLSDVDLRIDNTNLSPEETVDQIAQFMK